MLTRELLLGSNTAVCLDYYTGTLLREREIERRVIGMNTLCDLHVELHWLPVSQRINYKILLLTYKALNGQAPSYITELLEPYVPARNLRSSSKNLLKVPSVKLVSYGHRCFSFL